jgi:hypothetical protein
MKAIQEVIRQRGAAKPLSVLVAPRPMHEGNTDAYTDLADDIGPKEADIKKKVPEQGNDESLKQIGSNVADDLTPLHNKIKYLGAAGAAGGLGLGGLYGHINNITESTGAKRVLQAARSAGNAVGKADLPRLSGEQRVSMMKALKQDATENYMLGASQLANEKILPGVTLRDLSLTQKRIVHIPWVRRLMEKYPDVASRVFGEKKQNGKYEFDWGRKWDDELHHYDAYAKADINPMKQFNHVATEAFQNERATVSNKLEGERIQELLKHLESGGTHPADAQRIAKSTQWGGWGIPPNPEKPPVSTPEHLMQDIGWEHPKVYSAIEGPAKVQEAKAYFKSLLEGGVPRESALKTTFKKFPETAEHFYRVAGAASLTYAPWIERMKAVNRYIPPLALGVGGGGLALGALGHWLSRRREKQQQG